MASCCSVQRAVHLALLTAVAVASVNAVHAQEATAPSTATEAPPPPPSSQSATPGVQEVIVTGSRLATPNATSISPITTVSADFISDTGQARVEDILNNLPMIFAGENSTSSNGGDGTATVDLRGLGPQRTLVLVNGRRLGPGIGDGRNYSDINQIPAALIKRVDILTGGASSVYGADAVAGVVNFILDTHFEGVEVDAGYNFHQHDQHSWVAPLVQEAGDALPSHEVNTGFGKDVSILMGSNFADNRGNATVYATFDTLAPVLQSKYDYSACTLNPAGKSLACGGSVINASGYFSAYGHSGTSLFVNTVDPKTGQFRPFAASDEYNYGPLNFYQVPETRWTAGSFLNFDINSHLTAYSEVMVTRTTSETQVAPSGYFGETGSHFIPCTDPLLNASEAAAICDPANEAAQGNPSETLPDGTLINGLNVYTYRRNVEGGGRTQTFNNDAIRALVGLKGDITDAWTFDMYAQHSTVDGTSMQGGYLSNLLIPNALNVIPNPATGGVAGVAAGSPVCFSAVTGADSACVPWNIWTPGGVNQAALNYLTIPLLIQYTVTEEVADASVTGDLGKYGLKLPTADSGLEANFGTEWRQEEASFQPDLEEQLGAAAGAGGPTPAVIGGFHVSELFTEMRLPVLDHKPGADSLAIEGGYRWSAYSLGFDTNTFKAGLNWAPVQDVMFRGSYQRAVRAPNIAELYAPQSIGLDFTADPCAGAAPSFSEAQCALTGVTAAQYGHITANPSQQYNGLLGGNPNLQPETANTYSVGFVLQPRIAPGLNVSFDYYDINITGDINTIGGGVILQQCLTTGNPVYCDLIHRNANGSLWQSENGYVQDTTINVGASTSKGIDLTANYRFDLPANYGSLAFGLEGTRVLGLITQPLTGGPSYDCLGYEGQTCGAGQPAWRHVLNTSWLTPWSGLEISLRWRYIGPVASDTTSPNPILNKGLTPPPTAYIAGYNYFDLEASAQITPNIKAQIGIDNVMDKDPPFITGADCAAVSGTPGVACNGNTWPGSYDSLGRYVFGRVTAKF